MASPPRWPGYQAWITAGGFSSQGISTGPPVSSTTTVLALAAATASISPSWSSGSDRLSTSWASVVHWVAKTTAMSAARAAAAAAAGSLPST